RPAPHGARTRSSLELRAPTWAAQQVQLAMSCRVRVLAQCCEFLSHRDARALADQSVGWGLSQANCSPALHPQRTAVQPAPNLPLQERRELALPRSDCTRPSTLTNSQAEPSRLVELHQGPTGLGPF